jgi:hypothetical protein
MLIILTLLSCTNGSDSDSDAPGVVDCSTRPITPPTPRGEHDGVWDDAKQRLVFFGGDHGTPIECRSQTDFLAETWVWETDCNNFRELELDEAPKKRGRFATALDEKNHRMIVHGGRRRNGTSGDYTLMDDTWAFDLTTDTWEKLGDGPSERTNHAAAAAGDVMWLYGGNDSTNGTAFNPLGDLWKLDLSTDSWTEVTATNEGPGERLFHSATISPDGKTFYVYAGGDEGAFLGPFFRDLWALDTASLTWTELHDGSSDAPLGRIWPSLMHDGDKLLLWAGHDDGALGNTNELWNFFLDVDAWERVIKGDKLNAGANGFCDFPEDFTDVDLESPERRNADATVRLPDGSIMTFGGKTDCGLVNDLWTWDPTTEEWSQQAPATAGESCVRNSDDCQSHCF